MMQWYQIILPIIFLVVLIRVARYGVNMMRRTTYIGKRNFIGAVKLKNL